MSKRETEEAEKTYAYFKCRKCGKKYVIQRLFCDCGEFLMDDPVVYVSASEPVLGQQVNQDNPKINPCCTRCTENVKCGVCFGFARIKEWENRNGKVIGGAGCSYKRNDPVCWCCQSLIKQGLGVVKADYVEA
jgi:hypothetical protein